MENEIFQFLKFEDLENESNKKREPILIPRPKEKEETKKLDAECREFLDKYHKLRGGFLKYDEQDVKKSGEKINEYENIEGEIELREDDEENKAKFHYYHLKQKLKPKAVVFCHHGFCSHIANDCSGTFNYFARSGIELLGIDRRNHGKTYYDKLNEKNVHKGYIHCYKQSVEDCASFILKIMDKEKDRYEGIKIFIWGLSMGGAITQAIYHLSRTNEKYKLINERLGGLILAAPLGDIKTVPDFILEIGKGFALALPKAKLPMINIEMLCTNFKDYGREFEKNPLSTNGEIRYKTV